jgi:hypothetical protein
VFKSGETGILGSCATPGSSNYFLTSRQGWALATVNRNNSNSPFMVIRWCWLMLDIVQTGLPGVAGSSPVRSAMNFQ